MDCLSSGTRWVEDIAPGTAFLEVIPSDFGKAQGIIKLSKSKKTSV
jgi:hypothetical protein